MKQSTETGDKTSGLRSKSLSRLDKAKRLFFGQLSALAIGALTAISPVPALAEDIIGRASVIDGDTLEIHATRIRLFAIDAVESRQSCTTFTGQRWPCGRKSALALADKIGTRHVTCVPLDRDRYGRIVARCFVGDQDIAAWSVANGWALAWARYSAEYLPLQDKARSLGLGIWSGTFEDPKAVRKRN
jgi:endonuclease YncB( thermonuclease family)